MATMPTFAPSEQDRVEAAKLRSYLARRKNRKDSLDISVDGETITLSGPVAAAIFAVLEEMEKGHSLAVLSTESELSTQEAATLLNVSRPFVVGLLDKRELPYRMVGNHHRIPLKDVLAYKQRSYARSQ